MCAILLSSFLELLILLFDFYSYKCLRKLGAIEYIFEKKVESLFYECLNSKIIITLHKI